MSSGWILLITNEDVVHGKEAKKGDRVWGFVLEVTAVSRMLSKIRQRDVFLRRISNRRAVKTRGALFMAILS
jgi:hypothetical protein